MPLDKAGEPVLNTEVEWGRTYRHQRKQVRKPSIAPTTSPLNFQQLWEEYQQSKELAEIKELKRKLATKPKILKVHQGSIDPSTVSKKKYYEYMSTPHKRLDPPKPKLRVKKPVVIPKAPCSPRLISLALPTKVRVLGTWKDYQQSLPMDFITRLDELLHTDRNLNPTFARCYFKTLDRRRRKHQRKMRKQCRKRMKEKRAKAKEWLTAQINSTVDMLVKFLQKEPLFALNFKQMMLSEAILTKLKERGDLKHKPPRNTNNPYGHAIVDIVDQISVWIDTIVRYVDVQYTESVEEIVEVSSLESLGEGEVGEEEGEEEPKRFSLPPLPPLPDMPPLPLIREEGEDGGSTYGTTTALEAVLGEVTAAASEAEAEEGSSFKDMSLGEDALEMLIQILSSSAPEMLDELVNPEVLPGITYKDILERLNNLRDEVLAQQRRERQSVLENAMVAWAKSNEPDRVNQKILGKIQDAAGIISECLMKEAKASAAKIAPEKIWESAEESYEPKMEAGGVSEAEALSVAAEESLSVDETKTLATLQEDGESDIPRSTTGPTILTTEFTEGGEGEDISELDLEGSAIGPWAVRPTESQTKLLAESQVSAISEKDQAFEGVSKLDMTGDLKVVMGEAPSPELSTNVLGMTISQVIAKQEADKRRAMEGVPSKPSIPKMIPAHKPSKVFEHQPDTICCLTLKVWATWLLEVAHNAHAWSKWLNDIINEVRRIASIIRGDVKDEYGNPMVFYREDWLEFSEKVDNMITSWRQYSMHVKDLTDKIVSNFRGKTVTCCPKCLEDNLIVDVTLAHSISQQLAEAMNTAGYWRRWLDSVVMETKRLTGAVIADGDSQASSYGTMELIEIHQPHATESEESLYEIEELDPNADDD